MEINKQLIQSKKQNIKKKIDKKIDELLDVIEQAGDLDYFTIEIKNHEGNLNVECSLKNREKIY